MRRNSVTGVRACATGMTPGNFSPSTFFLDGSPGNNANLNLSALSMSAMSATGSKKPLLSPPMSDLKEVCWRVCLCVAGSHRLPNVVLFVCCPCVMVCSPRSGSGMLRRMCAASLSE